MTSGQMRFLFADAQDYIDPGFDFLAERNTDGRKPRWPTFGITVMPGAPPAATGYPGDDPARPGMALQITESPQAYQDMKDYKNAIDNYNVALQINPDFKKAYYQLALAYIDIKNYQFAAKMLKKYIQYPISAQEYEVIQRFISNLEKAS